MLHRSVHYIGPGGPPDTWPDSRPGKDVIDMTTNAQQSPIERLAPFIGTWNVNARFPDRPDDVVTGVLVYEWGPGESFLIQRSEAVPLGFPDAITIVGIDESRNAYLQHYFDSRGVARLYQMGYEDGEWSLIRTTADFTPLDFAQRYTGRFSDDLATIRGAWESSTDGTTWTHDFELIHTKVA
jgi:hypothetical protein